MKITDARGRQVGEAVVELTADEVTELLVAVSQVDDGTNDHALLRSPDGATLAIYTTDTDPGPLQKGTDWWVGPVVLVAVILVLVGAFTIARGFVDLLF